MKRTWAEAEFLRKQVRPADQDGSWLAFYAAVDAWEADAEEEAA